MSAIALDIGNVCLRIRLENCLSALNIETDDWLPPTLLSATDAMERGELAEKEWLAVFAEATGNEFPSAALEKAYNSIIGDEIAETRAFVETAVSNGFRVVFFSDTSPIHLDHVFANLSFAHLVTGGVYSFEVGAKKPAPAMFAAFEKRYGAPVLYLDDKRENIQGGIDAGWPSKLFKAGTTTSKELLAALNRRRS